LPPPHTGETVSIFSIALFAAKFQQHSDKMLLKLSSYILFIAFASSVSSERFVILFAPTKARALFAFETLLMIKSSILKKKREDLSSLR
jgi:hypothetical protein